MATFKFELVSPERLVLSAEVEQVDLPGTEGDFGVLAGHAPFLSTLRPGIITVKQTGNVLRYFVRSGFADVNGLGLTVLAERAVPLSDVNAELLAEEIKKAEGEVALAISADAQQAANLRLAQLKDLAGTLKAA